MSPHTERERVEFRCPHRRKDPDTGGFYANPLFAVILLPPGVDPEGIVEIACARCKQRMTRAGDSTVSRVIHRYRISGQPVDTLVQRDPPVVAVAEGR